MGGVEIFQDQKSIDSFLESVSAQYTNKTDITIDGVQGIRTHYDGFPMNGEQVVLMKEGEIYNIYVNSEKSEDIDLFDQIISSFKFIK